ncbi:AFG1-like ATPase family protein [Mycobacterium avium subsp. avium 2285 (R)]|nr:AFG1-like ATPase family protein [Mycobacterium avium subsp. avium 2285 (R)]
MHPSRYLTLIEDVTAVFLTGVHRIDDQNVALRLVSLTDRLYDAGVPVLASGRSWTPFSARRCSPVDTARSTCGPCPGCWR